MGDSPERGKGCGMLNAVFGRRNPRAKKLASLPTSTKNVPNIVSSNFLEPVKNPTDRVIARPGPNHIKVPRGSQTQPAYTQNQGRKTSDRILPRNGNQNQGYSQGKKVPYGTTGISGELESMITDHQRSKGSANLVRASSGNVMFDGQFGTLRQPGGGGGNCNARNGLNQQYKAEKEQPRGNTNSGMVNTVQKQTEVPGKPISLCRALSTRMDPEELKIMGNEDFKNGQFAEALALYEAAISIDPKKASYRSNKSAALNALGRVLEAVFECREAIRIDPFYQRAHYRMATLYLRLGDAEKSMYHYKQAGAESDPDVMTKAKSLQVHLTRCTDAKKVRDWNTLLRETIQAISVGADSAPQIFALKAEALLRMRRHQEAEETLTKGPNFEVDDCTKFFGPIGNANLLVIRAQVDMVAGRFDDAIAAAQRAARLDPNNKEANTVVRKTRLVANARSNGNDLFREQKYQEACLAYEQGLECESYNSILLCNRATCRAKLGQLDRAIEDYSTALTVRPSYRKAKLRRADCYAKLKKWEACLQDYEEMKKETPEDEDVIQGLKEAQRQLSSKQDQEREIVPH